MIELTFTMAFMLYLSLTLFTVMGFWIYSHFRTKSKTILTCEKELCVCEFCHYAYLEEQIKTLNKCPQCGLLNKNIKS
jgi:uncharacterized paraquat-inducible protein A